MVDSFFYHFMSLFCEQKLYFVISNGLGNCSIMLLKYLRTKDEKISTFPFKTSAGISV